MKKKKKEHRYHLKPYLEAGRLEAGCDEAGRGCLAGPVYAASVILPEHFDHPLLTDSKMLNQKQREEIRMLIEEKAIAFAVASMSPEEIDHYNILNASFRSMHKAIEQLEIQPDHLLIDGNRFIPFPNIEHTCVIKGDAKYKSIAAASILAKTYRDDYMAKQAKKYPQYGWNTNKGYPTSAHRKAIAEHGPCLLHRKSFRLLPHQEQGKLFD